MIAALGRMWRFVKVEHTLFSLPLLLAGAWLGAGRQWPTWQTLLWIALAGVGARTLGMAVNRIVDRRLDALNPRTAQRELPTGKLTLRQAWGTAAAGFVVYMAACVMLPRICLLTWPIPLVPLLTYSHLKRFTSLCHFGIGACLAMAPLGAFVAASGGLDFAPAIILLTLFAFTWISGFDIIYSLQDLPSDRETGVHSLPVALGPSRAQIVAATTHAAALACLVGVAAVMSAGWPSWLAVAAAAGAMAMGYAPWLPLAKRFFPTSAIAALAGALVPLLGSFG